MFTKKQKRLKYGAEYLNLQTKIGNQTPKAFVNKNKTDPWA
jgi:hypothetical protein